MRKRTMSLLSVLCVLFLATLGATAGAERPPLGRVAEAPQAPATA